MSRPACARSVAGRFSAAADTYEALAGIQAAAAREVEDLCGGENPDRILEIGCGTGLLTRLLLARFPSARITALDLSGAMIEQAKQDAGPHSRVEWEETDARLFECSRPHDLAASNCALHWIEPMEPLFANLRVLLRPGGALAFSAMLRATFRELHEARLAAAPRNPPASRLPELRQVLGALEAAGFCVESTGERRVESLFPSAADFLRAIHAMGLTGGAVSGGCAPLTRGEIERLSIEYEARFAKDGGVPATYHYALIKARRPY